MSPYPDIYAINRPHNFRKRLLFVIFNILCIGILLILPEGFATSDSPGFHIPADIVVKSLICVIVYYINYFWFIPLIFFRRRKWGFVFVNILLVFVAVLALWFTWNHIGPGSGDPHVFSPSHIERPPVVGSFPIHDGPPPHNADFTSFVVRDSMMLILIIGLSVCVRVTIRWSRLSQAYREMRAGQTEMELRELKFQLNPHFLFNTLNAIYALIDIDPVRAQSAVHTLSRMLRHMLYDPSASISLGNEMKFLSDYIELMKLRIGDRGKLDVQINVSRYENTPIAPLLLLNIVENAFKYGSAFTHRQPIVITCSVSHSHFHLHTVNAYDSTDDSTDTGIGLSNLRRRLILLYPDRYSFSIKRNNGICTVDLDIDISQPPVGVDPISPPPHGLSNK